MFVLLRRHLSLLSLVVTLSPPGLGSGGCVQYIVSFSLFSLSLFLSFSLSLFLSFSPLLSPSLPFSPLLFPSLPFSPLLSPSLPFSPLLSPSLPFSPLLSPSLPFSPLLSPSLPFSPLLSPSLPFSPLLSPSLSFSLLLSPSLSFSLLLSPSLSFSLLLSPSLSFSLLLSPSLSFSLLLSPSLSFSFFLFFFPLSLFSFFSLFFSFFLLFSTFFLLFSPFFSFFLLFFSFFSFFLLFSHFSPFFLLFSLFLSLFLFFFSLFFPFFSFFSPFFLPLLGASVWLTRGSRGGRASPSRLRRDAIRAHRYVTSRRDRESMLDLYTSLRQMGMLCGPTLESLPKVKSWSSDSVLTPGADETASSILTPTATPSCNSFPHLSTSGPRDRLWDALYKMRATSRADLCFYWRDSMKSTPGEQHSNRRSLFPLPHVSAPHADPVPEWTNMCVCALNFLNSGADSRAGASVCSSRPSVAQSSALELVQTKVRRMWERFGDQRREKSSSKCK